MSSIVITITRHRQGRRGPRSFTTVRAVDGKTLPGNAPRLGDVRTEQIVGRMLTVLQRDEQFVRMCDEAVAVG